MKIKFIWMICFHFTVELHVCSTPKAILHSDFQNYSIKCNYIVQLSHICAVKWSDSNVVIKFSRHKTSKKKKRKWCFNLLNEVGNMMSDFSTSKLTSSRGHWFANRCRINLQWLLVLFSASKFNERWCSPATALTAASCQLTPMAC